MWLDDRPRKLNSVRLTPQQENVMNIYGQTRSFGLLLTVCVLAACVGGAHGGDQVLTTQLSADGALSIRLGADQLLRDSLPKLYHFDWLVSGEKTRPEYHWMTRPTEQRQDLPGHERPRHDLLVRRGPGVAAC